MTSGLMEVTKELPLNFMMASCTQIYLTTLGAATLPELIQLVTLNFLHEQRYDSGLLM